MRFYFEAGATLYSRSGFPVAIELIKRGHEVYYSYRKSLASSLRRYIDKRPRHTLRVSFQDENTIRFLELLCGTEELKTGWDFLLSSPSFHWASNNKFNYDAKVITKKMPTFTNNVAQYRDKKLWGKSNKLFILPYEQYPYLSMIDYNDLDELVDTFTSMQVADKLFNVVYDTFVDDVTFGKTEFNLVGWPWYDQLKRFSDKYSKVKNTVLYTHSGGLRGALTNMGDDLDTCIKKQRAFFSGMYSKCPSLRDKTLIVKIHPLAPLGHREKDLYEILSSVGWKNFAVVSGCGSKELVQADFEIGHGGSTIYDHFSLGNNFYILGFPGKSRFEKRQTKKGLDGKEGLVNPVMDFESLEGFIKTKTFPEAKNEDVLRRVCTGLFDGNVCTRICDDIERFIK